MTFSTSNEGFDPHLRFDVAEGVATLTIDREERRNALTWSLIDGLRRAVEHAAADADVRVIVITGAGTEAFCAGADLGTMRGSAWLEQHEARGGLAALFEALDECGTPTIAKVRGYCLAGGFGLALACDLVIAEPGAVFATPEINVGLWPYMITVPLCRSMPPKKALELMMTGRRIGADEADRLGLLTRVVPADRLDDEVAELAATLASKSPAAMRLGRNAFYAAWGRPSREALSMLHPMLTVHAQLDDAAEGIAAFAEKREPQWRGR